MPLSSPSGGTLVHSEQAARELGFDLHRRHTGSWADGSVTKPGSPCLRGSHPSWIGLGWAPGLSGQSLLGYLSLERNRKAVSRREQTEGCWLITQV